jgi:hypothetical protein
MDNDFPDNLKSVSHKTSKNFASKLFIGIVALIIVVGLSFWGGAQYQKSHSSSKVATTTSSASNFSGGFGGGGYVGRAAYGSFGTVTAISSTSISVQDTRSGSTKSYVITSSTIITDNSSTVTYSDIQDGDTVIVTATSTSPTTATRINVNPSYGGNTPATGSQTTQGT